MKLKLPTTVSKIEVFYDGHCGMCASFIEWLVSQDLRWEVVCLPYQSDGAKADFPELTALKPDKEIIVRVDGQKTYRGAEGWVWCLWSTVKYRDVAKLVNSRLLLPMAKKVCYLVSKNRLRVSKLLFHKKAKQVADEIHKLDHENRGANDCNDGNCEL